MQSGPTRLEAVQQAKERLGEASAQELAAYVEMNFGLKVQPAIVSVLLASLREREALEHSRAKAMEAIERARADEQAQGGQPRKKKPRSERVDAGP